jgi:hypothetical protein
MIMRKSTISLENRAFADLLWRWRIGIRQGNYLVMYFALEVIGFQIEPSVVISFWYFAMSGILTVSFCRHTVWVTEIVVKFNAFFPKLYLVQFVLLQPKH